MPQQKERDATLADRPCPTIHVSMLAHLNVLWCPDFILWGLFLLAGRGCLFWGSHATGAAPALIVALDCGPALPGPLLSVPVRCCPSRSTAPHGTGPWRPCTGPVCVALPVLLFFRHRCPGPGRGCFPWGPMAGALCGPGFLASLWPVPVPRRTSQICEAVLKSALFMAALFLGY